ncbi:sulfotransferase family protein [Glacieibacterium frigidum]|uniref:Sulfotransferase n=1 Tax=Glacieibacterium frigidum TaxID=2593303 RepID=A0A552UH21_9SPHN|nr:sulfotransferase [Glacieibacterium frigidum]TRW17524.1 sulfotransferase [Glacieibacterium frigidum]
MFDTAIALRPSPQPATPGNSNRRVAALNGLLARSWASGLLSTPSLDPAELVATAVRQTGLDDLGRDHWRPALEQLCRSLETEADLNPFGRTVAHGQIVGALKTRLRAHALWQRHPEILETPLSAPIVVLGQMRSGTTRLQRLLACDPRLDHTRFFESSHPLPQRGRKLRAAVALQAMAALNRDFAAIHPTGAGLPDEEIGLFAPGLISSQFEVQWRVPGYARWCEAADTRAAYAEFRALLQTLRWLRGRRDDRPWVLKVPQFTQDLPALLASFPDARLLCVERDRAAVVGSAASLVHNQMQLQSDAADPHWIGREWLGKVVHREGVVARTLAQRPCVPRHTVDYARMDDDWLAEMQRVYDFLGLPLTAPVAAAMTAYIERSAQGRRPHRYAIADFGLCPDTIADRRAA